MATIEIYGYSDDLIEIHGDIREEFDALMDKDQCKFLAFADGTVLRVTYDTYGIWRITPIVCGTARYSKEECLDPDTDGYSDKVTLVGDIKWVVCGTEMAK